MRKLSDQQLEILRASYLVNRITQDGNAQCKVEPETIESTNWYCNLYRNGKEEQTAYYPGPPDMANNYAAWLVLRLPYRGRPSRYEDQRPLDVSASQSASIKRTIRRLKDRGYLIGRRYSDQYGTRSNGYLLTAEGFDLAASLPELVVTNIDWFHREIINRDNYAPGEQRADYRWEFDNTGKHVMAQIEEQQP